MAPGQTLWFGQALPRNFADEPVPVRALLLHELTHSAQDQAGMDLIVRGLAAHVGAFLRRESAYDYARTSAPILGRPFEHQAAMVEDAYRLAHGVPPRRTGARLEDLLAALGHSSHLPGARDRAMASLNFAAPPLLRTPLR